MDVSHVIFKRIMDTSTYDVTGTRTPVRQYVFYIGDHGPFTENIPLGPPFDASEIDRRVSALQMHLSTK